METAVLRLVLLATVVEFVPRLATERALLHVPDRVLEFAAQIVQVPARWSATLCVLHRADFSAQLYASEDVVVGCAELRATQIATPAVQEERVAMLVPPRVVAAVSLAFRDARHHATRHALR
jgi:hypothetical protein